MTLALNHSQEISRDQHHRLFVDLNHRDVRCAERHRDVHGDTQVDQRRPVNEDMKVENCRDRQVKQHSDVAKEAQSDRSFDDLVHREVQIQLMNFLDVGNMDSPVTWQPYAASYYAELATLCLQDSLKSGGNFVPILTECLSSSVYDVRLASLQFLSGVFDGNSGDEVAAVDDDNDNDDTDSNKDGSDFYPLDASSLSAVESRKLLREMFADADAGLLQVLIDMLLYRETHDECLLMVSSVIFIHQFLFVDGECFYALIVAAVDDGTVIVHTTSPR